MFHDVNLFENENERNEYVEKFKKGKGHMEPMRILYQLEVSPRTMYNLSTCPLVLKPTKLSGTDVQYEQVNKTKKSSKKRKKHKRSKSGHEESEIKQTNMDESILTGLQTVIDLCGLLEKCEKQNKLKQKKRKYKQKMEPSKQSVQNSCHFEDFSNFGPNTSVDESTSSKVINKPSNTNSIRKLFFRKSGSRIKNKFPSSSSITLLSQEQSITSAELPNQFHYNQALQILTSSTKQSHSQDNAIHEPDEAHISRSGSKKSVTTPNMAFINNMKPIEEEPQGSSKHHIQPEYSMESRLSRTDNKSNDDKSNDDRSNDDKSNDDRSNDDKSNDYRSNDDKSSAPSCELSCNEPVVKQSGPALRNRSSQDDIHYYWKTKSENAKTPISPCEICCMKSVAEKSPPALRNRGEQDDIQYYWKTKNESEQTKKLSYEGESECLHNLTEGRPPHRISSLGLVKSPLAKTPINSGELHSKRSCCATPRKHSSEGSYQSKCCTLSSGKHLSTKYFPPVEVIPAKRGYRSQFTSAPCNPEYPYPLYKPQIECKKSRHGVPVVQPVMGICRSGRCGTAPRLKSIKYALVKISEFIGFNTYEIMKPYRNKPKNIPTCIAEIFVTSQKRNEKPYVVSVSRKPTRINFQVPGSPAKSMSGVQAPCSTVCSSNQQHTTSHVPRFSSSTQCNHMKKITCAQMIPESHDGAIMNQLFADTNKYPQQEAPDQQLISQPTLHNVFTDSERANSQELSSLQDNCCECKNSYIQRSILINKDMNRKYSSSA